MACFAFAVIVKFIFLPLSLSSALPVCLSPLSLSLLSPVSQEQNVTVQHCVFVCTSETVSFVYQAIIFVWLFMMQVVGIVLAFETRKVKIKVLNDAKYVTVIIYVCSIVLVIYGLSSLALSAYLHTNAVLKNTAVLLAASIFLGLNFIPKVGAWFV